MRVVFVLLMLVTPAMALDTSQRQMQPVYRCGDQPPDKEIVRCKFPPKEKKDVHI